MERRKPLAPGKGLARGKPLAQGSKGLKRGAPLKQGKPLDRGSGLARGTTPLKRVAPTLGGNGPTRTYKQPKPARRTGATTEVRALVVARDGGRCQRCGAVGTNVQHREGRGMGGRGKAEAARTNTAAWLVLVCGQGNTSGCHKAIDEDREQAVADGYVILRNAAEVDAATVPVRTFAGLRYLTHDGRSVHRLSA